jgi:hypothetical protein
MMLQRCLVSLAFVLAAGLVLQGQEAGTVPLDKVHTTSGQKGVKRLSTAMDGAGKYVEPYGQALGEILRDLRGGPQVVLVAGDDIAAAVKACKGVLGARDPKAEVTAERDNTVWAAVYFGTNGSSPPAWQVEAVTVKDKTIRVAYKKQAAFTDDIHHYLAWIPLGKAQAGAYTLELFDVGKKQVTHKSQAKVVVK